MSKEKTPHEINCLIDSWLSDPCWDLYNTEGFEAHREFLKDFQEDRERMWRESHLQRVRQFIKSNRLPGFTRDGYPSEEETALAVYLMGLEKRFQDRIDYLVQFHP